MTAISDHLQTIARARIKSRVGQWAEAEGLWSLVVESNPTNGEYWDKLGEARFASNDYQGALGAYRRVLGLGLSNDRDSGLPGATWHRIARCYARLDDCESALGAIREALRERFRDVRELWVDEHFVALRGDDRFRALVGICDVDGVSRNEGWASDLNFFAREAIRKSPLAPVAGTGQKISDAVARVVEQVPTSSDAEVIVELWKVLRLLADGHARITIPALDGPLGRVLPIQFYSFEEGLHITAVEPALRPLLGALVVEIDGRPIATVLEAIDLIITRDNQYGPIQKQLDWLRQPAIMHALGMADGPDGVTLGVKTQAGQLTTLRVESATPGSATLDAFPAPPGWLFLPEEVEAPTPHYLRNAGVCYWFDYMGDHNSVYFQMNMVVDDPEESLLSLVDRMFDFIYLQGVNRLIIDLRLNRGGNMFVALPLVEKLIAFESRVGRGSIFLIIGRKTSSAAQIIATLIERHTRAIVVGEPTGSSPNFTGETYPFTLPYSRLKVNVSDLHWQNSTPLDNRVAIAPDVYLPPTFEDYVRNHDPVVTAIVQHVGRIPGW